MTTSWSYAQAASVTPCGSGACGHGRGAMSPVLDSAHLRFRWDAARTRTPLTTDAMRTAFGDAPTGTAKLIVDSFNKAATYADTPDGGWSAIEESPEMAKVRDAIAPLLSPYGIDADAEAFDEVVAVPGLLDSVLSAVSEALGVAKSDFGASAKFRAAGPQTVSDVVKGRFRFDMALSPSETAPSVSARINRLLVKKNETTGEAEDSYYPGDEDIPERDDTEDAEDTEDASPDCSSWWPTIEGCTGDQSDLLKRVRSYMRSTCSQIPDVTDGVGLDYGEGFRDGDVGELSLRCDSSNEDAFAYFLPENPTRINLGGMFFDSQPFGILHELGFSRREVRAGMLLHEAAHALQQQTYGDGDDVLDLAPFPGKYPSCYYGSAPDADLGNAFKETTAAYVQYLYYGLDGCTAQAAACGYGRRFTSDFGEADDDATDSTKARNSYTLAVAEILACGDLVVTTTLVSLVAVAISAIVASAGLGVHNDLLNIIVLLLGAATAIRLVLAAIHLGLG